MKFIARTFFLVNLGFIIALLFSYMSPYIDPRSFWPISIFGLFFPILLIVNVFFLIYWLIFKPKYAFATALCLVFGWGHIMSFYPFNSASSENKNDKATIFTNNISHAFLQNSPSSAAQEKYKKSLQEFIKQYDDVDVFCFQEVGEYAYDMLRKALPKHHVHYADRGAVIFSKYAIKNKGKIEFGTRTNSCLWADIKFPHDVVRVYSFHLQSNAVSTVANKLVEQKEIDQKQAWYDIKSMLRLYRDKQIARAKQIEMIQKHLSNCPHKYLLAGDLNDTPQSNTYHKINSQSQDAYKTKGNGIGSTYHGSIPLLRIDYIFVDPSLKVFDCQRIKNKYSDHHAVYATVEWSQENKEKP